MGWAIPMGLGHTPRLPRCLRAPKEHALDGSAGHWREAHSDTGEAAAAAGAGRRAAAGRAPLGAAAGAGRRAAAGRAPLVAAA
eukprot:38613-Chlamydomonas_euryale.AAC.9